MEIYIKTRNVEDQVSGWKSLPMVKSAEGCVFMVNEIRVLNGFPVEQSVAAFVYRLERVLRSGHITGRLAPIHAVKLAGGRLALAAYMRSTKTREELNEMFGETILVPEGEIGEEL